MAAINDPDTQPAPLPASRPALPPTPGDDLSALSWVQEELRRSLELAHKALRRYLKEQSRLSELDTVDPGVLRQARSQLHQSVGVLELVGLGPAAELLRAAEAALLRLSARPKLITPAAVDTIERGSFALLDFIARRLADKPVSTLSLFPQYRALQELAGASRVHPADLWAQPWSWRELAPDDSVLPRHPDADTTARIEADLLALMRGAPPSVAARMSEVFAGLAAGAQAAASAALSAADPGTTSHPDAAAVHRVGHPPHSRLATLWQLAAGFFEAQADGLLQPDAYSKRLGSKLLGQLRAGETSEPSERLAHDLLFFCGQATPREGAGIGPRLAEVRHGYALPAGVPVNYEQARLGRFDPAWVAQARKRVAAAKEVWSAVAGGDAARLPGLAEQFALVADSLGRLYPDGAVLGRALQVAAGHTVASGGEPPAELAMEVATALLYLDASLDDGDFDHPDGALRVNRLAQRIDSVRQAKDPGTLELWMEELYRRVSDRQTMGSVVQELRASLSEIEKNIDQYFRNPAQREVLIPVPAQLSSMRGVLSVLGLDQASQAVLRMRDDVDALASTEVNPQHAIQTGTFDRLADNLGALSFLIDMVSVQPQMAKSLFRFDAETGNLAAVMAREDRPTGFDELDTRPANGRRAPADTDALAVTLEFDRIVKQARATQRGAAASTGGALQPAAPPLVGSHGMPMLSLDSDFMIEPTLRLPRTSDEVTQRLVTQPLATLHGPLSTPLPLIVPAATAPFAAPPAPPAMVSSGLEDDPEMREIFLEEAQEVMQGAREALAQLQQKHDDAAAMTTVRRAFHTLKGSARMVGLVPFGEAAWACEQLYNARLAEPGGADHDLRGFTQEVCGHFERWVAALAAGDASAFQPGPVVHAADVLRNEHRRVPLLAGPEPAAVIPADSGAFELEPTAIEALLDDLPERTLVIAAPIAAPIATPPQGLRERIPDLPLASDLDLLPAEPATTVPALPAVELPAIDLPDLDLAALDDEVVYERTTVFGAPTVPPLPETAAAAPLIDVAEATELDLALDFEAAFGPSADEVAAGAEGAALADRDGLDLSLDLTSGLPDDEAPDLPFEPLSGLPAAPEADLLLDLADEVPQAIGIDMAPAAVAPGPDHEPEVVVAFVVVVEPEPEAEVEEYRQIGPLRIGIPLFNIYLNEADELSRRLGVELAEWTLEPQRPVGEAAVALAHSLAGSSGTVGYADLSQLARVLEHALGRSQTRGEARGDEAALFNQAADEIRRLLHLFAAGFLQAPDAELMRRLHGLAHALPDAAPPAIAPEGADVEGLDDVGRYPAAAPLDEPALLAPEAADRATPEATLEATNEATPEAIAETDAAAAEAGASLGRAALLPFTALADSQPLAQRVGADSLGGTAIDEDIDQSDVVDEELFPIFVEEARDELLPQLHASLRDWARRPADAAPPSACMRCLHNLKGSARLAGAMRLGEIAHRLETLVSRLATEGAGARAADIDTLIAHADTLQARFEALQAPAAAPKTVVMPAHVAAPAAPLAALPQVAAVQMQAPLLRSTALMPLDEAAPAAVPLGPAVAPPEAATAGPARIDWSAFTGTTDTADAAPTASAAIAAAGSVRVRTPLLDRLVNQAGEVSIARSRIESDVGQLKGALVDLTDNLERLRSQLRDIELQAETQIGTRMEAARAAAQQFDPLEMDRFTRFQELTRMMAESVADVATVQRGLQRTLQSTEDSLAHQARMTRDMQDDLLRTRMVEFEGLSERLYRVVRQAAKETAKPVRLNIVGGSIEIDRGVLDRMTPAFEHLLRNSVVHGIESPEQRAQAGKEATGTITLAITQVGNEVGVEVRDDGGGLHLDRIRERGRALGLIAPDAEPDDAALANLIFQPGFSTATSLTGLAGRGVGMDVVRTDVNAMGGRIDTASAPGQGTSFRLVLPLTTAVTQVVMLRCGDRAFAVPSTLIEIVRRIKLPELAQAYDNGVFVEGGQALPFFWLDALLDGTPRGMAAGRSAPVVVIRSAAQRVVLHVDEVLGNQEVVVKNLGPQLARVPGLVGMTLLPSGLPALIYNPVALATLYGDAARQATRHALADARGAGTERLVAEVRPQAPLVLVVDDSLTVRRITQRLLQREGYRVTVAKDGLDGLDRLAAERPAVLLTDIEMPRMDGFDLVRNMRADARLADLPVIMITSRIAQKHRDYAAELGVDHYLGKPYVEDELLSLVARYARRVRPAA